MRILAVLLVGIAASGVAASSAYADGDPASDVLVSQRLFLPSDVSVSPRQRAQLRGLLAAAGRAGYPIRVAVIASGYDLGSVTALWRRPRTYARFLGIELSLVHRQPLLVVMPDGFGFDWPGHPSTAAYGRLARIRLGSGGHALIIAAQAAVRTLAAADGHPIGASSAGTPATPGGRGGSAAFMVILAAILALLGLIVTRAVLLRHRSGRRAGRRKPVIHVPAIHVPAIHAPRAFPARRRWAISGLTALCCAAAAVPILVVGLLRHASASGSDLSAVATPYTWGPGRRRAPAFRLTGENGRPLSLAAYRGRPVIVTFVDPLCRNLCPLAAHVLNQVDRDMPANQRPVIIAVSVDVYADSRADLRQDFRRWDLVPQWHWAVGAPRRLEAVWRRYHVAVSVKTKKIAGTTVHFITHDEVAFVIDRSGYVRALYGWPYYPQNVEAAVRRLEGS